MHGGRGLRVGFGWENQNERDHQNELDVGGIIILRLNLDRMGWYGLG
jgi:hypothetical protein